MAGDRQPYDYRRERTLAAAVLMSLIAVLIGVSAVDRSFRIDDVVLAQLIGALLAVLGLGELIRRRRSDG